jgi:hypothetical protein
MNYTYLKPTLLGVCDQLTRIIQKGEAFVQEGKATEAELIEARLAPDMFPFVRQIQIATDNAKGGVARLAGMVPPVMEDTETTFAALKARVAATRAFVESVPESALENVEGKTVRLQWMPEGMHFAADDYAQLYVLQNTLFHVVTAYDILRMKGVQLGKQDFIGRIPMHQA